MRLRFRLIASLSLCLVLLGSGCIGRFGLVGEVRKFNLEQSETRWGREIWFVLLYVIPIYPLAGLADILIFNSLEFWQGTNPINGKPSVTPIAENRTFEKADGTRVSMAMRPDTSIDVEVVGADGAHYFVNLSRTPQGVVARDRSGVLLASAANLRG